MFIQALKNQRFGAEIFILREEHEQNTQKRWVFKQNPENWDFGGILPP